MSHPPESAPIPPVEDDRPPPKPPLGPAFWIALLFGFVCVVAGYGLARLGPRLLPPHPAPAPTAPR